GKSIKSAAKIMGVSESMLGRYFHKYSSELTRYKIRKNSRMAPEVASASAVGAGREEKSKTVNYGSRLAHGKLSLKTRIETFGHWHAVKASLKGFAGNDRGKEAKAREIRRAINDIVEAAVADGAYKPKLLLETLPDFLLKYSASGQTMNF